jgi:3-dehydroquinate synthase
MNTEIVRVELGPQSSEIGIGHGNLKALGERLRSLGFSGKSALISNPTIMSLYGEAVTQSLRDAGFEPIYAEMRDGEDYKNLETCAFLWDCLLKARLDRKSPVIALGGGVVGDVAGFIAATYMRGIPLIQVPTTLLAQVDSSVGGKTGIDHPEGKNLIGAFHQPRLVWIDTSVLSTLPVRELRCGLAEAIKYGVIADAGFFSFLEREMEAILRLEPGSTGRVVRRCCEIKAEVVARDEREGGAAGDSELRPYRRSCGGGRAGLPGVQARGRRRPGDGGGNPPGGSPGTDYRGNAVASNRPVEGGRSPIGLPRMDTGRLLHTMTVDKKAQSGQIRVVLPERIGQVRLPEPVDPNLLQECLVQSMEPHSAEERKETIEREPLPNSPGVGDRRPID